MAVNDPIWSYGEAKQIKSSGTTVAADDDIWIYGENELWHEYVAAGGGDPEALLLGGKLVGGGLLQGRLIR